MGLQHNYEKIEGTLTGATVGARSAFQGPVFSGVVGVPRGKTARKTV